MVGYIASGIISYCSGFLFGVISKWRERFLFWIMIATVIVLLIAFSVAGDEIAGGFDILKFVIGVICSFVGILSGGTIYEEMFHKDRYKNK